MNYRFMRLLAMVYIVFLMAATVMSYKVIDIWGIAEPGSTLIYTFTYFIGNIYAELYGQKNTNRLIVESVLLGYIFALLITTVNYFPSPAYWDKYKEFDVVLGHVLRFTSSGVIGYLLSALLNAYLITKWKYQLKGKYFWARSLLASSISEGVSTFVTGFATFLGMLSAKNITVIMINALLFKLAYGLLAVWPATFIAYILKKNEYGQTKSIFPTPARVLKIIP